MINVDLEYYLDITVNRTIFIHHKNRTDVANYCWLFQFKDNID